MTITTQSISMILVSFFSEENALSDEIKIHYATRCIFEYQSDESRAFRFFWDTRYNIGFLIYVLFEVLSD